MTTLRLGVAYYPEHWPKEQWDQDIEMMRQANITVVRMTEFAWSTLEPSKNNFSFDWLEEIIEKLAKAGIQSVLGTPSASPPAWLIEEHPDILPIDEEGRRIQFGNRNHYCVNSSEFHSAVKRINTALAKRFGKNPNVIGWQIDNEFNRICYCPRCQKNFQDHLAEKYETLDNLNQRWTTAYWSQTYSNWKQVPLPIGPHNPGLMLEFRRFTTNSYRKFQKMQIDDLRPHLAPGIWITHNFMGWLDPFDYYDLAADLDLASWDWYEPEGKHNYLHSGSAHDLIRGLKQQNFWVIETQPGHVNWGKVNIALDRWKVRSMAWQAIAHGAEAVLYWQWRNALNSQEQFHGSFIDQAGKKRPIYHEISSIGKEFQKLSHLLEGSSIDARIAIINDYPTRWSLEEQPHHAEFDYAEHLQHYYRPLAERNLPIDIISQDQPLDHYKLVIAPALTMVDEALVTKMENFVNKGGYLIITIRTGLKDKFNAFLPSRPPGALSKLTGVEVEEYYALDQPVSINGQIFKNHNGKAKIWAERLKILDKDNVITSAHFGQENGWLEDQPAITTHRYGKGIVYTIGAFLNNTSQKTLIDHIVNFLRLRSIETPPGVEAYERKLKDGNTVWIVINHTSSKQVIEWPWLAKEHVNEITVERSITFYPYMVAVFTKV